MASFSSSILALLSAGLVISGWSSPVIAEGDDEKNYYVSLQGLYMHSNGTDEEVWVFDDNVTTAIAPEITFFARADDEEISRSDELNESWQPGTRLIVGGRPAGGRPRPKLQQSDQGGSI